MTGLWLAAAAWAGDAPSEVMPTEGTPPAAEVRPVDPNFGKAGVKWYPIMIPAASYNSIDGVGLGFGGEIHSRRVDKAYGYEWMFSFGVWSTWGFKYQDHWVRVDHKGEKLTLSSQITFNQWTDMHYAGLGGKDVLNRVDLEQDGGNFAVGPSGFVGIAFPLEGKSWSPYVQVYSRYLVVEPDLDGRLAEEAPFGIGGGFNFEVSGGIGFDTTDRWPLPSTGHRGEVGIGLGGTATAERDFGAIAQKAEFVPMATLHAEISKWVAIKNTRWVFGARLAVDHVIGKKPFFEQDLVSGRWRDEMGAEQLLSGYGRTRTRGDGVVAAMIEFRPMVFQYKKKSWDIALYGSLFAEQAWLFEGWDPGPPMPSLGFGPELVWQSAFQLRPYVSWGWRADEPGGKRQLEPAFGISFLDPL